MLTSRSRASPSNTTSDGLHPYRLAWQWREAIASPKRQAFEELSITCGGPTCGLGMSNALHPRHCQGSTPRVAEVSPCKARWGPCSRGATFHATLRWSGGRASLATNGEHDAMFLHLFQSKGRWRDLPDVSDWTCVNMSNLMGKTDASTVSVTRCS